MRLLVNFLLVGFWSTGTAFVANPHRLTTLQQRQFCHRPIGARRELATFSTRPANDGIENGNAGKGEKSGNTGWVARLKASPLVYGRFLRAVVLRLQNAFSSRTARGKMTPGRRRSRLERIAAKMRATLPFKPPPVLIAALLLLLFNKRNDKGPRLPPPSEVPYSEVIRLVEKKPEALIGGIAMGNGRWDFSVALPVDHPVAGIPLQAPTPSPPPTTSPGSAPPPASKPPAETLPSKKAPAAGALKAPSTPEWAKRNSFLGEAVTSPTSKGGKAAAPLSDLKAVRVFTRPVGAGDGPRAGSGLDASVLQLLRDKEVVFGAAKPPSNVVANVLRVAFPVAYLWFLWTMFKGMTKGPSTTAGNRLDEGTLPAGTGFHQVAGVGAAKREVSELVDMLTNPAKFAKMGARLPAGVLLVGPPGTGKTLLARAVAAEAGVPFFYCSGSDFMEMFVGRGAARVRQLFAQAKKTSPAIVFVDELDAIGRSRSTGAFGGFQSANAEAEQTLNQLLACMDGLDTSNDGVTVVAATNRVQLLDEALLRPGRFDRIVKVDLPDEAGRRDILGVHSRSLKLGNAEERSKTLDLAAAITPGASGAELAALVNEAAIRAVRRESPTISSEDFVDAVKASNNSRGRDKPTSLVARLLNEGLK